LKLGKKWNPSRFCFLANNISEKSQYYISNKVVHSGQNLLDHQHNLKYQPLDLKIASNYACFYLYFNGYFDTINPRY